MEVTNKPHQRLRNWRRRLLLAVVGFVLLLISIALDFVIYNRPYPVKEWDNPFYLAVLTDKAKALDVPALKHLGEHRDYALLLWFDPAKKEFSHLANNGNSTEEYAIPREYLDFDPDKVLAATDETPESDILINDLAEGIGLRTITLPSAGEILVLQVHGERFASPYFVSLTLYSQVDGELQSYFSSRGAMPPTPGNWMVTPDGKALLTAYYDGIGAYQWNGTGFVPQYSAKQGYETYLRLVWFHQWTILSSSLPMFCLVFFLWLVRAIRFAWSRFRGSKLQANPVVRGCSIGCLCFCLLPILFMLLVDRVLGQGYFWGVRIWPALIAMPGWICLGLGALVSISRSATGEDSTVEVVSEDPNVRRRDI